MGSNIENITNPALPARHALRRDIIIITSIKVVFITLLWALCFSHPPSKHIDNTRVVSHLLAKR